MSSRPDVATTTERRGNKAPIPTNVDSILTPEQALALRKIENFGWRLAFIRQPLFEPTVTVVVSPDGQRHAVLEADGEVNLQHDIVLRH